MNCAYIRLSEEDEDKDKNYSASILNQIALVEDYARRNNILIHKKYIDDVAVVKPLKDEEAGDVLVRCKGKNFVFHTSKENLEMEIVQMPILRGIAR